MSFNALCNFVRLGNSAWDFLGVKFLVKAFFGVLFEALRIFFGFDFAPIQSSLSLEIWSPPPPPPPGTGNCIIFFLDLVPMLGTEFAFFFSLFGLSILHCWRLFYILLDRDQPVLYPFNSRF